MADLDRKTRICTQTNPTVTGLDFLTVLDHLTQDVLHVFFLIDPLLVDGGAAFPTATVGHVMTETERAALSIAAPETGDIVTITRAEWRNVTLNDVTRKVLEITVAAPGGPELYDFTYDHPDIDRFFDSLRFSFKQGCPSGTDCRTDRTCPDEGLPDVAIDYLARDFGSLRGALIDFAAGRYPEWELQIEADAGMMLLEIMAALGDDFAYQQDRLALEGYLSTATQPQSVENLARLVDYERDRGQAATTLLTFGVSVPTWTVPNTGLAAPDPSRVFALREDLGTIPFEATAEIWLHDRWNDVPLYLADAGAPCLEIGATEAYLDMALPVAGDLPPGVALANPADIWLDRVIVLRSGQFDPANPSRSFAVTITAVSGFTDPLVSGASEIVHLTWAEPLPFQMPIAQTRAYLNAVPAVAGRTVTTLFRVGDDDDMALAHATADPVQMAGLLALPQAVEREGACAGGRRGVTVRHGLPDSDLLGVSWDIGPDGPAPVVGLTELAPDLTVANTLDFTTGPTWQPVASILDADGEDRAFTLESGLWGEALRWQKPGGDVVLRDYLGGAGFSIRFGDRAFGISPAPGTVFEARFLTAPGLDASLPRDTITRIAPPEGAEDLATIAWADWVTNPFAVTNARPPETLDRVRENAPQEFRQVLKRAVRNEDYRTILEARDDIQQANAQTRWTGAWLTDFVAVDPFGTETLSPALRAEIATTLECVRQAGRQVCLRDADYVPLDLAADVCLEPDASNAAMIKAITAALEAYFDPDRFTFGTALIRSAVEATIACVPGVRGVEALSVRRRGKADFEPLPARIDVAPHQILQLANDPARPERGFVVVTVHGGG